MKYGDTLRQRSIPEWSHYNVDYDVIKGLIKEHTTPGTGKAVSIPGQGNHVEKNFEKKLYAFLLEENERVNLFVRSKAGEIERRLNHLDKQLANLDASNHRIHPGRRPPPRRLERYAQLDKDVLTTGQEVNSLSRFINTQKTAFRKLLKKYKKWTRSEDLVNQFMKEATAAPDSFWNLEVEPLFDQYTAVLHVIRSAFQENGRSDSLSATLQAKRNGVVGSASSRFAAQIRASVEANDLASFDALFASVPSGSSAGTATYWVHPDCLIELRVLLLQHSRLCVPPGALKTPPFRSRANSRGGSPTTVLKRAGSDVWKDGLISSSKEDDIGIVILDDLQRFVGPSGEGTSVSDVEEAYQPYTGLGADARWTYTGDAVVSVDTTLENSSGTWQGTRLKRKYLRSFFDLETPFNTRSLSFSSLSGISTASNQSNQDSVEGIRKWLKENSGVKPMSGICAKRSRFAGLVNSSSRGVWATLDRDIVMTKSILDDCVENDWSGAARREGVSFPYAVLQVRYEGLATDSLIQVLDSSHLTERIRGFSLEKHAIWECCRPNSEAPPPWLPALSKDIRKLPAAQKRHSRRSSSVMFQTELPSSQRTSTSTGSVTDAHTNASTPALAASSNTSVFETSDGGPSKRSRKEGKRAIGKSQLSRHNSMSGNESRYWSEYDHPEDGDEPDAYYIYFDPDEDYKWPGTDTAKAVYRKVKDMFTRGPVDEETSLLRPKLRTKTNAEDSDSDSTSDDDDIIDARNYGSIRRPEDNANGTGFLNALFPTSENLHMLPAASSQPPVILALENREREREQTKQRLSITSLLASVAIMITVIVLRATGRKRLRPEVDAGMIFGIVVNLTFAFVGVGYLLSRRDDVGWLHRGAVFSIFAIICIVDGMMVASMIA